MKHSYVTKGTVYLSRKAFWRSIHHFRCLTTSDKLRHMTPEVSLKLTCRLRKYWSRTLLGPWRSDTILTLFPWAISPSNLQLGWVTAVSFSHHVHSPLVHDWVRCAVVTVTGKRFLIIYLPLLPICVLPFPNLFLSPNGGLPPTIHFY